jgi:hypothetical protein
MPSATTMNTVLFYHTSKRRLHHYHKLYRDFDTIEETLLDQNIKKNMVLNESGEQLEEVVITEK